jgi:aminotransferase
MISVFGSSIGEEEIAAATACLKSQWMGAGPIVEEFEHAFAARLQLPNFAMVNSGSNALYLAVKILDLPPGSEVILPSFTWIACAQAILLNGCTPVFADVDLHTHNITAGAIRPHITPRTAAIMVVHYAGKPVDMEPILALGFPVIEDAAHAVDSTLYNRPCGSLADVGIFSFDAVKNLACPEGGGLTARDPARFARARALRYCGIEKSGFAAASTTAGRWWEYAIRDVAPKLLSNDLCAAVALAQLHKLDALQRRRQEIWQRYQHELAPLDWLVTPANPAPHERHSYFTYCLRLPHPGARDRFAKTLYDNGIYTTLRYHPLHQNKIYNSNSILPISDQLNEEALSIPIHPRLSDDDVTHILNTIRATNPLAASTPA